MGRKEQNGYRNGGSNGADDVRNIKLPLTTYDIIRRTKHSISMRPCPTSLPAMKPHQAAFEKAARSSLSCVALSHCYGPPKNRLQEKLEKGMRCTCIFPFPFSTVLRLAPSRVSARQTTPCGLWKGPSAFWPATPVSFHFANWGVRRPTPIRQKTVLLGHSESGERTNGVGMVPVLDLTPPHRPHPPLFLALVFPSIHQNEAKRQGPNRTPQDREKERRRCQTVVDGTLPG